MQHMGDDESKLESQRIEKQIQAQEMQSKQLAYFLPPVHTQLGLNAITQTDMSSYLWFQQKSEAFHEELRMQFYPLIFDNRSVKEMDWTRYNRSFFRQIGGRIYAVWWTYLAMDNWALDFRMVAIETEGLKFPPNFGFVMTFKVSIYLAKMSIPKPVAPIGT